MTLEDTAELTLYLLPVGIFVAFIYLCIIAYFNNMHIRECSAKIEIIKRKLEEKNII